MVKSPQLFSCYFSHIHCPQQSALDTHDNPAAPGLPNNIFEIGDLAPARLKLLLLPVLHFIRKVESQHCLLDFPAGTHPFSCPCPNLSTEFHRGNAALTAFSGEQRPWYTLTDML